MRCRFVVLALCLAGCPTESKDTGNHVGTCSFFMDFDADGFGDPNMSEEANCASAPASHVDNDYDCDDANAMVNPTVPEICDGLDNDCDGTVDQSAVDAGAWYPDVDQDGWGDGSATAASCSGKGLVDNNQDCDDQNAVTYPDAPEICDLLDNDCDGVADEDLILVWYADVDADGFGDPNSTISSCDPGIGFVQDFADCDDQDADVHPGSTEVCDGVDQDCDGQVDEDLDCDGCASFPCPLAAPPIQVLSMIWNKQSVYYVMSDCCDQMNPVFDLECNYLCSPDGGYSGSGDGLCPDFWMEALKMGVYCTNR